MHMTGILRCQVVQTLKHLIDDLEVDLDRDLWGAL